MSARRNITALLALAALGGTAQAQSFSADLTAFGPGGQNERSGKVHVDSPQVRIDAPELPEGFFVDNAAEKTAYYVRPSQFIFMDAKQSSQLTQLLVIVDPNDPCAQWQVMAKVADVPGTGEWRCERIGEDTLDGRATLKFRATSPRGASNIVWIDPQLKFLVKYRNEDGSGLDVSKIQEGPQDKSLFEIPSKFEKFDPKDLIERVKESDVWVEPPKN